MRCEIHPVADFSRWEEAWRALLPGAGARAVLEPYFVSCLQRAFGSGREVLAICRRGEEVVALGVLTRTRQGAWETFQPAQAPLGLWVQARDLAPQEALAALILRLPGVALLAGLTQLDPEAVARPSDEGRVRTLDYIRTAHVPIDRPFETYWAERGKNLLQNMRKQRTRMQKDGIVGTLDVLTESAQMAGAIADYGRLESAGWKGSEGTAVHPDNTQGTFYRDLLERACAHRAACVYRYRFGDEPIAMDLCVRSEDAIVILKTAYDERLKGYSPAMLMRQESFAQLFADGRTRRIEFYGRVMDWHMRLTQDVRTLYHLNFYRWAFLPGVLDRLRKRPDEPAPAPEPAAAPRAHAADTAS